jgi:fructuronate reductase
MDSSQKLPPRLFDPALDALAKGQDIDCFAYASATWMVYVCKTLQTAGQKGLNDPRADEIATAIRHARQTPQGIADALCALPGFMPDALRDNPVWQETLVRHLTDLFAAYL